MTECTLTIDGVEIAAREVNITHEAPPPRNPGGDDQIIVDAHDCVIATENIEPLIDTLSLDTNAQNH